MAKVAPFHPPAECSYARFVTAVILCIGLSACASQNRLGEPIVDLQGTDPVMYDQDLAECRTYASEVALGAKVGTGAAAGAVLGGLIGAAVGDSSTAQRVAGAGAVHGGARGGVDGVRERSTVVKNCLRHRGYKVLN